jgi:hypothetical protein
MSRLRRTGLAVSAALLVIAITIPPSGVGIADASLKAMRGGSILYCSYPLNMGPGCTACRYVRSCPETVNGMPMMVDTYSQCINTNVSTLCFVYQTPADPTPTCDTGARHVDCGIYANYSFVSDCSNLFNDTSALCGTMGAYWCSGYYDQSTSGPMATGVNCQNANGGTF